MHLGNDLQKCKIVQWFSFALQRIKLVNVEIQVHSSLTSHVRMLTHSHTHFHLHYFYSFLSLLSPQFWDHVVSYFLLYQWPRWIPLSERAYQRPHSWPPYRTQDFRQAVEAIVLFFKLQCKQGEGGPLLQVAAAKLNLAVECGQQTNKTNHSKIKNKATNSKFKVILDLAFKIEVYFSTPWVWAWPCDFLWPIGHQQM